LGKGNAMERGLEMEQCEACGGGIAGFKYKLTLDDGESESDPKYFCNYRCLIGWVAELLEESDEAPR